MTTAQMEYKHYLNSWRWRLIRSTRRMWDGNRCRTCGEKRGLNVHHSSYLHKNSYNWLLAVPVAAIVAWMASGQGFGLVLASVPVGLYGFAREWLDVITVCSKCHGGIHDAHQIRDFAD